MLHEHTQANIKHVKDKATKISSSVRAQNWQTTEGKVKEVQRKCGTFIVHDS